MGLMENFGRDGGLKDPIGDPRHWHALWVVNSAVFSLAQHWYLLHKAFKTI